MNTDRILVAVSAYAGDKHQVENNLPLYKHHGCRVVILSPADAPIESVSDPAVLCLSAGKACWFGPDAVDRHIKFMEIMVLFPHDHFLFNDSDSLCITPALPEYLMEDVIWSNEVADTHLAESRLPKLALQPPYFFSRGALLGMLSTKNNLPPSFITGQKTPEGYDVPIPTGCPDHLMLQLAHGSGYAHKSFYSGASFETKSQLGQDTMAGLVHDHGKNMLHSIKTKEVLDRLLRERR